MSSPRRFTLEEATALLPIVGPLLETLRVAQLEMETHHDEVMASTPLNGGGAVHAAFLEAASAAEDAQEELSELGVVIRDPSSGLVDFPTERDGRIVFLCWRLGEERISWWHPTDTGFAGRQPL